MKPLPLLASLLILLPGSMFAAGKPNIVYILADDMGYADPGFNGGKDIKTPHDALILCGTQYGQAAIRMGDRHIPDLQADRRRHNQGRVKIRQFSDGGGCQVVAVLPCFRHRPARGNSNQGLSCATLCLRLQKNGELSR